MSYHRLVSEFRSVLAAGFLLSFFSGFGQSYFISVFTPMLLETLNLSQARFGLLYAGATLSSAALLPWIGSRLDHGDAVIYARVTCTAFICACIVLALAQGPWQLALGLFGLRFCGQGLFTHIAMTVTARGFSTLRGRALSLVGLGHPASEAILPLTAVALAGVLGWRGAWFAFACALLLLLPLLSVLMCGPSEQSVTAPLPGDAQPPTDSPKLLRAGAMPAVVRQWRFWFLVIGMIIPGTLLTGLFIYHGVLAQLRGWTPAWMAAGFIWFALAQVLFSLVGGVMVDRWGSRRVFTLHLLPLAVGLGLLQAPIDSVWVVPGYLFLAGITNGFASPIKTAIWAENYDTRHLATLRSWAAATGVLGTAVAAPVLGVLLDAGFGFGAFLYGGIVLILFYSGSALWLGRKGVI